MILVVQIISQQRPHPKSDLKMPNRLRNSYLCFLKAYAVPGSAEELGILSNTLF